MRSTSLAPACVLVSSIVAAAAGAAGAAAPSLVPVATYDTGLGANGAEIVSIRKTDRVAALTNVAGSVDLLDLGDPSAPTLIARIPVGPGVPNSVAIHPQHDYVLVASGAAGAIGRVSAYGFDGTLLHAADAGIQPDSVAISADGRWAVVANEAEGVGLGNSGGEGSVSVVDLAGFNGKPGRAFDVETLALPSQAGVEGFSTGRTDDVARRPVDNSPASLEPETVAFAPDDRHAFVTLQENSGVLRLDVATGNMVFFGTGRTVHAADTTVNGSYAPTSTLDLFREPDGIGVTRDAQYFVTADEGDTRTGSGSSGIRGGRTVSVFDATTGAFVGDTGNALDDAAAAAGVYPDARSNRGGSEPEVLDVTSWRGATLAAVGLERANSVALVDLADPTSPVVVALGPTGQAPEGIKFMRRGPELYVVTANEVSGTVSILRVDF